MNRLKKIVLKRALLKAGFDTINDLPRKSHKGDVTGKDLRHEANEFVKTLKQPQEPQGEQQ